MNEIESNYLKYSILEYIKTHFPNTDIAISSLSSLFSLSLSGNEEYRLSSTNLETLFLKGVKNSGIKLSNPFSFVDDSEYKKFLELLNSRNYFKDYEKESKSYKDLLVKANKAYLAKLKFNQKAAEEMKEEGNSLVKKKEYKKAIECYKKAIDLFPKNPIYYSNMASSLTNLENYDEAINMCDKAIEIDKTYVKAYLRKAIAFFYKKDYQKSIELYEYVIKMDPSREKSLKKKIKNIQKLLNNNQSSSSSSTGGSNGGIGGLPEQNLLDMFNNPQFINMAQQISQQPMFQNMLNSMMSGSVDPNSMLGGFNNAPIPEEAITELEEMDEVKNSPKLTEVVRKLKSEGMSAIMSEMGDPEVSGLMQKLSTQAFRNMNSNDSEKEEEEEEEDDDDEQSKNTII